MKVLNSAKLNKYEDTTKYEKVYSNIYKNIEANNYCFACECSELVEQYPLEDLLDLYSVSCTEFYGDKVLINGEEKYIIEFETSSTKEKEFLQILALSTIIGKEIVNVLYKGKYFLAIKNGMSEFSINNITYRVPIFSHRWCGADYNIMSFNDCYPEGTYFVILGENQPNYGKGRPNYMIEQDLSQCNFEDILIIKNKAILRGTNGDQDVQVIIGLNDKIESVEFIQNRKTVDFVCSNCGSITSLSYKKDNVSGTQINANCSKCGNQVTAPNPFIN